jgi:hypothetical protein
MPRIDTKNRGRTAIALLVVPLACLGLGACGSSSSGSSSSASTPATTHTTAAVTPPTPPTPTTAPTTPASTTPTTTAPQSTSPSITSRRQFTLIYECMRHKGTGLPPLKGLKSLGEIKVNTNTPQYKAALEECRHAVLG